MRRNSYAVPVFRAIRSAAVFSVMLLSLSSATATAETPSITVAAASSLTELVDELGAAFAERTGVSFRASYSASSVAARQVMNGAPFDILISANPAWIAAAEKAGALDPATVRTVAGNTLSIIASPQTPLNANKSARAVLNVAGVNDWPIAIADPDHVPAGQYAMEAMRTLGVWENLKSQMVPLQNVRAVVALVDRGETPIGFAYATDLRVSMGSREVARFKPGLHAPIRYRAGIVSHAPSRADALAFLEFAISPAGQRIVESFGFLPLAGIGALDG